MSFTKWEVGDIEETRLHLNELQKKIGDYIGIKKVIRLLLKSIVASVRSRFFSEKIKNLNCSQDSFFVKNPDFKPYQIKVSTGLSTQPKRKILHVIPSFITGGSQQLIVDIIEGLSDSYLHEVALAGIHAQQGYAGITIHDCSSVKEPTHFEAILQHIRPDIVHVHYYGHWPNSTWYWYHAIFQGAFIYNKPVIENCNIPYMPYFDKNISKYVYVSEYAQDTFGIRALPNEVIYPGSNFSFFQRDDIDPDPDTIGMVYRLDGDKVNEHAIMPFIRAVQMRPATKVIIVGGGQYLIPYQEKVIEAGLQNQFTFTGYVAYEKLADLYRQLSVFVAPVYSESFGQVTPFAMNMGIPIAAYNVGALEEILFNPAVLAPSENVDALAEIIVKLLNNPAERAAIGNFNKKRAEKLFEVKSMVDSYRCLYGLLLR